MISLVPGGERTLTMSVAEMEYDLRHVVGYLHPHSSQNKVPEIYGPLILMCGREIYEVAVNCSSTDYLAPTTSIDRAEGTRE